MLDIKQLIDQLTLEKQNILEQSTPLRQQRDRLKNEIAPIEQQIKILERQYRDIEQPRLAEIDNQLSMLHKCLGARSMLGS